MPEGRWYHPTGDAWVALLGVTALDAQQPDPADQPSERDDAPGTPPPAEPGAAPSPPPGPKARARKPKPPGLIEQLRKTGQAAGTLVKAHVDLAKEEASSIGRESGKFAGMIAAAIGLVIMAALLGVIGSTLFIGEWLLGSIGWGVLEGILAFLSTAVALVLLGLGVSAARIGRALLVALVVGILTGVILGLGLANQVYASIGDSLEIAVEPGVRPLVVGLFLGALVGLILGIALAARATRPNWFVAIAGGLVLGALAGAFTSITFGPQVGAGIGITLGYLTWAGLMGLDVYRTGIDMEALKARFTPTQTIETSKETLEWLQQRMPRGNGS